jgi:hypothetical protein
MHSKTEKVGVKEEERQRKRILESVKKKKKITLQNPNKSYS